MNRHRAIGLLLPALLISCQDELPGPPSNLSIEPTEGPDNAPTEVTIRGDFIIARLGVDLGSDKSSRVDDLIGAWLSDTPLTNVGFVESGTIKAVVPRGLARGLHDLMLRDPEGGQASLAEAFRIRKGTCADLLEPAPGCDCTSNPCRPVCGDGAVIDEQCDDGNAVDGDGCSASCELEIGWTCNGAPSECKSSCGDGMLVLGEICDDGNRALGDGCDTECQIEPDWTCHVNDDGLSICQSCGNGILEGSEACDDMNVRGDDGCAQCEIPLGWSCTGQPSLCGPICGDGIAVGNEGCDDRNTANADGCNDQCQIEAGFCCRGGASGNPSACFDTCGDGYVDNGFEQCDDGNTIGGDGCGACCGVQPGWYCLRQPSLCVLKDETSFVDESGPSCFAGGNGGTGTFSDPYCEIQQGVNGPFETVVVRPGTYGAIDINGVNRRIFVEEGAKIVTSDQPGIQVRDGAHVEIVGIQIESQGPGLHITNQGTDVTISECTIGPMDGQGARLENDAHLTMNRCTVRQCLGGGLFLGSAGGYGISNTIIAENGDGFEVGGVYITTNGNGSYFVNNTVANNSSAITDPSGVVCLPAEPIPLVNSIIWDDRPQSLAPASIGCAVRFSNVSGVVNPANGNVSQDPIFDSRYRIDRNSPCIDGGDPAGVMPGGPAPRLDIDGDPRPKGMGVDIGADEAG